MMPASSTTSSPPCSPRTGTVPDLTRPSRGRTTSLRLAQLRRSQPYPWQAYVADVAGELNDDRTGFRYPIVVLSVPRRAGKSALMLATCLDRMDAVRDCRGWYTMQTGTSCTELFRAEWAPSLDRPSLERVYRLRRSEGRETVEHRGTRSARVRMFAPEKDALHGMNADIVVVDEAWAFDIVKGEALEAAIRPAQLTRPWRQLWIVSAGGTIESTWWDRWLQTAETADTGLAVFDYGADPTAADYDPGDPRVWARSHPTAGYGFPLDALAAEWATRRDDASFERAYLNVWPRPSTVVAAAGLDLEHWTAAADPAARPDAARAIALDVAADRSAAAIAVAGFAGDRLVVEIVDARPGVGWLPAAVKAARATFRGAPVVADALVAASTVAELRRVRVTVDPVSVSDHARACGTFVDLLAQGAVVHRAQAVLDDAVAGASRRPLGDAWLWSRARSRVDISPLVAATLAVWVAHARRRTGRPAVVAGNESSAPVVPPDRFSRLTAPHRPRSA